MIRYFALIALSFAWTEQASAQSRKVLIGPLPAWVLPPPVPSKIATPPTAAYRFIYNDTQLKIGPDGQSEYVSYRLQLLKPDALDAGNLSLTWSPENGEPTLHVLRIWREGTPIDLLKSARFTVLQREGGLEAAALDGRLTATFQTPGLRVGDELEFAATVRRQDPVLGADNFGIAQMPVIELAGAFRTRLVWPPDKKLTVRGTRDLPPIMPAAENGLIVASIELRDPAGSIATDGAPQRFNIRRQIEYSTFDSWEDVSRLFWPLYQRAESIAPGSPLEKEIDKIKEASADPGARVLAALRLVQDQVRYVYVGLNGGNYRPASADETWQRRFGDCKAKTALLIAILRAVNVQADAVLVSTSGDDGMDRRLPAPGSFNHVLVRAKIGAKSYWLDGTRLGDRFLDRLPAPRFRWALAISSKGSSLEPISVPPTLRPTSVATIDVDARAGFTAPAKIKASQVMHDDEAFVVQTQLSSLSPADSDRLLRAYWAKAQSWVDPVNVAWRYDERNATLLLTLTGTASVEWEGNSVEGRNTTIVAGGFYPPDLLKRSKEQDQMAPWVVEYPRYRCWASTLRLPESSPKFGWRLYADPMNTEISGTRYFRASSLTGNVVRVVKSTKTNLPEITADAARANNAAIATFNNKTSTIEQIGAADARRHAALQRPSPFNDDTNWTEDAPACGP